MQCSDDGGASESHFAEQRGVREVAPNGFPPGVTLQEVFWPLDVENIVVVA